MTKKFLLSVSCIFVLSFFSKLGQAQEVISFGKTWGQAGFNVEQQNSQGLQVTYSVPQMTVEDVRINGEMMKSIGIDGVFLPNDEGMPNLPGTGRFIAIPQGATASVEIVSCRTEVINDINIAPAPRIPKENEDGLEYHKDFSVYNDNAFYPSNPVKLSEPTQIRGVDVVTLGFTPFQYNPVTRQLIVYKDIRVKVNFQGGNGHFGEDRLRSRWFDPLLNDMLINPGVLGEVNYNLNKVATEDVGYEYLIIIPNDPIFAQWADSIHVFRSKQGIITGIKTLAEIGGNTTTAIENFVNTAYNSWTIPPVAVLILGDYGTNAANTVISPIYNNYCASDNIYSDVNADQMPDMVFARMTAQDAEQLATMVTKFIHYEKSPPTSESFYDHPISALGWQTERWFQICSEVVGGFWKNSLGKNPVRINAVYQGNPNTDPWSSAQNTSTVVSYFGPGGLNYIPSTPQGIGGFSGGTAAQVNVAINEGSFMLQHRDHGFEDGWGEPDYTSTNIPGLTNTDLCFVMSINCLTGKYNYSNEVFTEKFHRYKYNGQNSGALGLLAASETSYSFVNDAFVWGVYDNMWPGFMPAYGSTPSERGILPAFGNAAGKYFLQQSSWPYNTNNKEVTYNLFHHHGDAFLSVYSEVPQSLTVSHEAFIYPGAAVFAVSADSGSLICLSLNGEILGTGTGTGVPANISIPGNQLPPDIIDVVVTKQNYLRYEGQVLVIPPSGPYVIKENVTLVDAGGNGNGLADFGEDVTIDLSMKNIGVIDANNVTVTLTSTDPFIQVTDMVESFGTLLVNQVVNISASFAFSVNDSIPDGHIVPFTLTASNGTNSWTSYFSVILNAPILQVGNISISDTAGNNNGRLDAGETADILITTKNLGHADLSNIIASLSCIDTNIILNSVMATIPNLNNGGSSVVSFNVTVAPNTPNGTNVYFTYNAYSMPYTLNKSFVRVIGVNAEDWESGNFTQYPWINNSNVPWTITNLNPYEGIYTARSGTIGNNANTVLQISMNVLVEDSVSFYRRVSSEPNYDFLEFYIDNVKLGQWSGDVSWARAAFPVSGGVHSFKWRYVKDSYSTAGLDAAWIDYIIFPPFGAMPLAATATAAPANICPGGTTQLNVTASGGTPPFTYNWSPTGSLSNPAIVNPLATPGSTTTYLVTVTDNGGQSTITSVTVNILSVPATPNTPTTANTNLCAGVSYSMLNVGSVSGAATYTWTLAPAQAGTISGTGISANITWAGGYLGSATIDVKAGNSCGQSSASPQLTMVINPVPSVSLAPLAETCVDWPPLALQGGSPAGGVFSGNGVANNMFTPSVPGLGTWPITYTYSDSNNCSSSATMFILVGPCTGLEDLAAPMKVEVYPNPNNGQFAIEIIRQKPGTVGIYLQNLLGEAVFEELGVTMGTSLKKSYDLGTLPGGIYMIRIEEGQDAINQKIIVERK